MTGERKLRRNGQVEATSTAPPEAVWAIVSDVTRIGEWSHECREAGLLDGAKAPAPGVRFQGRNTIGRVRWARTNEMVRVDAPREFAWRTVPSRMYPDSTEWTISIEPVAGGGCRITQRFVVLKLGPIMDRLIWLVTPAHRDRLPALEADLVRLAAAAAATSEPAPKPDTVPRSS
jgi:hypothetical protein